VVASSGGTYGLQLANSNLNLPNVTCLPDGCYDLTFSDSANDGMCPRRSTTIISNIGAATFGLGSVFNGIPRLPGDGSSSNSSDNTRSNCGNYTLTDANGTVLTSGGGRFGSSETNNFCISGGVGAFTQPIDSWTSKVSAATHLQVQPNIVENEITVIYKLEELADAQLFIIDINGKILQQHTQGSNNVQQVRLNVSELAAGFYFVKLVAGDTMFTEKFVKR